MSRAYIYIYVYHIYHLLNTHTIEMIYQYVLSSYQN